jgi:predicted site-specific integrase-resolvase
MFTARPALLRDKDLAKLLGVADGTPANWRRRGVGPRVTRVRRSVRYKIEDVESWIAEQNAGATLGLATPVSAA